MNYRFVTFYILENYFYGSLAMVWFNMLVFAIGKITSQKDMLCQENSLVKASLFTA